MQSTITSHQHVYFRLKLCEFNASLTAQKLCAATGGGAQSRPSQDAPVDGIAASIWAIRRLRDNADEVACPELMADQRAWQRFY
jgi:hypothetical protein